MKVTNKQLRRILKQFNNAAEILVNGNPAISINAAVNQDGKWEINITEVKTSSENIKIFPQKDE